MSQAQQASVVLLDWNELQGENDFKEEIHRAFGVDGLGILCVKNVPGLAEARMRLLPLAREFAILDDAVKEKYVHKESFYSFGWSHGKEKLQGKMDVSKGSYYANPQYDRPVDDEETIKKYSPFIHPNIWPTEDLPALEPAFKELGQIVVNTGILVSRQCDKFVKEMCPTYETNRLENIIVSSKCCKARLLHYFPQNNTTTESATTGDEEFSSWCGWHNDHGSLTGLVSALFIDANGNIVSNTDPTAGLYIRSRNSELFKVAIPPDCIAYQIGETAQIHSGGILQATPHAVRGSNVPGISRETFAVFMEPMWMEPMCCPENVDGDMAQSQSAALNLPRGVPSLESRWNPSQTFGEFTDATLNSYY